MEGLQTESSDIEITFEGREMKRDTSSPDSERKWLFDVIEMFTWFNKPENYKENLHMLTEKIQKRYFSAQMRLQEKDDELKRIYENNAELIRSKARLQNHVVRQEQEIQHLKVQLEGEKWGNYDVGVNVSKMKHAVIEIHSSFGGMIDSLRVSNSSLGQLREHPSQRTHAVEELQYLQSEIDKLFGKVRGKLERWERNQLEMQEELYQTKKVLDNFFQKLTPENANGIPSAATLRAAAAPSPTQPGPVPATNAAPLYIHKTVFSPERFNVAPSAPQQHQKPNNNFPLRVVQSTAETYQNRMAATTTVTATTSSSPSPSSSQQQSAFYGRKASVSVPAAIKEEPKSPPLLPSPVAAATAPNIAFISGIPVKLEEPPIIVNPFASSPEGDGGPTPLPTTFHSCTECEESFITLVQLRLHCKLKHKGLAITMESNQEQQQQQLDWTAVPIPSSSILLPSKKRKFSGIDEEEQYLTA